MRYEDPVAYVDKALAAFDEGLEFDPENSAEALADQRARELMEEVA